MLSFPSTFFSFNSSDIPFFFFPNGILLSSDMFGDQNMFFFAFPKIFASPFWCWSGFSFLGLLEISIKNEYKSVGYYTFRIQQKLFSLPFHWDCFEWDMLSFSRLLIVL